MGAPFGNDCEHDIFIFLCSYTLIFIILPNQDRASYLGSMLHFCAWLSTGGFSIWGMWEKWFNWMGSSDAGWAVDQISAIEDTNIKWKYEISTTESHPPIRFSPTQLNRTRRLVQIQEPQNSILNQAHAWPPSVTLRDSLWKKLSSVQTILSRHSLEVLWDVLLCYTFLHCLRPLELLSKNTLVHNYHWPAWGRFWAG